MSMDYLLKASDHHDFVSLPVYINEFYRCAKINRLSELQRTSVEQNLINEGLGQIATTNLLSSIDVSDLRDLVPNPATDMVIDADSLRSQIIMKAENSRRRNAQYESIALRALKYDRIERSALARHSPNFEESQNERYAKRCKETTEKARKSVASQTISNDDYSDLIMSVAVCYGYSRELAYHEIRLGRLLKVTTRVELTGNHTLQDLKNAFSCPTDFTFTEDFSEKVPTVADLTKNKYPSGMFFIHDTFYIEENTSPNWEDPSEVIRNWAASRSSIGPFNVKCIKDQKLGELTARLGQPYVFIHQGVCEHLVIFTGLTIRDDSHEDVDFPRTLVERNFRRIACNVCKEESAKWMIAEHDDLLPCSPGYLCVGCYEALCFDSKGGKVCNFIATPYCDRKEVGNSGEFIKSFRF